MISFSSSSHFEKTSRRLQKLSKLRISAQLDEAGKKGLAALSDATPKDTAQTSAQWGYKVLKKKNTWQVIWTNSNVVDGVPVVILLQYGHATRDGGYIQGRDFINPAIKPIFDQIKNDVWRAVRDA